MATFFETRIRYSKVMENGKCKRVTERYLFDAESHTEAEAKIISKAPSLIGSDTPFEVTAVKKTKIESVHPWDNESQWWLAKTKITTLDERTGIEKKSYVYQLVEGDSIERAKEVYDREITQGAVADIELVALIDTDYMEVFA